MKKRIHQIIAALLIGMSFVVSSPSSVYADRASNFWNQPTDTYVVPQNNSLGAHRDIGASGDRIPNGYFTSLNTTAITIGGAFVGPILNSDGTAAAPAYSFSADTNTGIYRIGADDIGFSTGGSLRADINGSGVFSIYNATFNPSGNGDIFNSYEEVTDVATSEHDSNFIRLVAKPSVNSAVNYRATFITADNAGASAVNFTGEIVGGFYSAGNRVAGATVSNLIAYEARSYTTGNGSTTTLAAGGKFYFQGFAGAGVDTITTAIGVWAAPFVGVGVPGTSYGAKIDPPGIGTTQWTLAAGAGNSYISGSLKIGSATAPDSVALLDLGSTTKGFLPPRMTAVQKNAITPVEGLIVHDTTNHAPYTYDGGQWRQMTGTTLLASGEINMKVVAATNLYTVPVGKKFILQQVWVETTDVDTVTVSPTIQLGSVGNGYQDYLDFTSLIGLTELHAGYELNDFYGPNVQRVFQAGDVIGVNVTTGSTATTQKVTFYFFGYLI